MTLSRNSMVNETILPHTSTKGLSCRVLAPMPTLEVCP